MSFGKFGVKLVISQENTKQFRMFFLTFNIFLHTISHATRFCTKLKFHKFRIHSTF